MIADALRRIRPVSAAEAETADLVVCCTSDIPSPFTDNVDTSCADCQTDIYHRPTAPVRPPKLCIACAGQRLKKMVLQ